MVSPLEALVESAPTLARAIGAVFTAVAGASVEVNGLGRLGGDPTLVAAWVLWIGLLLLFSSYLLASEFSARFRTPDAS